jgi:hypothetical protein
MANPVFDHNTLLDASGCYSAQTLGLADRMAINIANLAAELNSIGGTNYVGNLDLLVTDSACYATLKPDQLEQIKSQIINNNATAAGATIGDISAQLLSAACIRNASKIQLMAMELNLMAKLGTAKAYPQ